MVTFRFGEHIVIHRRVLAGQDAYGNDTFTEQLVSLDRIPAIPTSSVENENSMVYDLVTVLLPPNTDIDSIDGIEVYGNLYEVFGQPVRMISPFSGENPGIPVNLRRVTG